MLILLMLLKHFAVYDDGPYQGMLDWQRTNMIAYIEDSQKAALTGLWTAETGRKPY